ncbi:uncharacterized protein LOC117640396 [Thrips palmi]|uniref:Uncharacterized protein LOC117640396 n=1 Tax=Thrips palmi TaxID=161013 RepID=A0A6P8Y808_THRPL|nr:uncharacterized protein LOC117640396 [Thrips palmi]
MSHQIKMSHQRVVGSITAEQSWSRSGDTLIIETEDLLTLENLPPGNSGSSETICHGNVTNAETIFEGHAAEFNLASKEIVAPQNSQVQSYLSAVLSHTRPGDTLLIDAEDFTTLENLSADYNSADRDTNDGDLVVLSDTEESFVLQEVKQELSEINNNSWSGNGGSIKSMSSENECPSLTSTPAETIVRRGLFPLSAQADYNSSDRDTNDGDLVVLSDTEESFVLQEEVQALSEINNNSWSGVL